MLSFKFFLFYFNVNVNGIPKFIEEGKSGWLFNPNYEDTKKIKLREVLSLLGVTLEKSVRNGLEYVNDSYKIKKYVIIFEVLYGEKI